jgi:hypothetical protein
VSRDTDCTSFLGAGTVCTEETITIGTDDRGDPSRP